MFCANLPSQQARGASHNLLLLLRKDCLFCQSVRVLRTAVPFDQSGIHKEPIGIFCRGFAEQLLRVGKTDYLRGRLGVYDQCGGLGGLLAMPVFQEQGSDGYRFVVRPNCALSWRTAKLVLVFFTVCFAVLGVYFAALGAWLVLPFAGLELVVLVAGFYLSALAGHTREVIEVEGPVLRVLRGGRRLEEVASLPANWTRVELRHDPRGWYPSRLLLRWHGKGLEVGAKLVEAEREELAVELGVELGDSLGFGQLRGAPSLPGTGSADSARDRTRRTAGSDSTSGTSLGSDGARAAGCASGACINE